MGFGSIILLILKIIGIVLASILGLLLLLVIIFMLVPFRYRIDGHKLESDIGIAAVITWLLHLLRIDIRYAPEGGVVIQARLFGRLIYDSTAPVKPAKTGRKRKTARRKSRKPENNSKEELNQESIEKPEIGQEAGDKAADELLSMELPETDESTYSSDDEEKAEAEEDIYDRILHAVEKFLEKFKHIILAPYRFVMKLKYKKDVLVEFLHTEENKAGLGFLWKSIKKLLRHMRPRRIKGHLEFGLSDPASTGYILAGLGVFYGKYGRYFRITPNFTEVQLECEVKISGRVISGVIVSLFLRLWFNRNFKLLRKNFEKFKEDIGKDGPDSTTEQTTEK